MTIVGESGIHGVEPVNANPPFRGAEMRRFDPWRLAEQFVAVFLALVVWSVLFLNQLAG